MALAHGTRLGPYEIVASVGAGGMGEVYRARDSRLGRDVAIKILPASFAQDGDRLRRFEQEARAVAALNHPNILTVYDVGSTPVAQGSTGGAAAAPAGSPYLVTELLEGTSLRERLASGALSPRKVIEYATQVARGLAAAHERGIVHRDLKPDNIFVTADGRVKILDFGLAKLTEPNASGDGDTIQSGTQAGVVMGTLGYMSPEQVRGKLADARSDIFSFGAVLYEMVSGKRAFTGATSADVMSAILKDDPPELTPASGAIAPALDHIIRRCLEKEPPQRFQSAGDLAFQIAELSGTGATSAIAATGLTPQRRRHLVMAAGLVGVITIAVLAWYAGRATLQVSPVHFQRITFQQGVVDSARFLPDGQSVVVAARWGDDKKFSLYTGRFDSAGMRALDTPADQLAAVSSSGEMAVVQDTVSLGQGYVRAGTLARAPLGGGAPRPVLDFVQYADWSSDGSNLAIVRFVPAKHTYRLEYPVGTVLYETSGWISDPRISRDGKRIAFIDHPAFGDDMGYVNVLETGGERRVVSRKYTSAQGLAWSPNGKEIWYSASVNGPNMALLATSLSGKVRPLLEAPGSLQLEDILPDGRILVVQRERRRILKVSTADGSRERDFSWLDWSYDNFFSFDGKQIVFGDQDAGEKYGVFMRSVEGSSAAVQLGEGDPMDISRDGKWVITRLQSDTGDLELLPTGAGDPKVLTNSKIEHRLARFMPDGQHIVFIGNESGHPERTFLLDLNGKETPITPEGVVGRVPSPDGKSVLVRMPDKSLALQPAAGGAPQPVPQLKSDDIPMKYSGDGKSIFVAKRTGSPNSLELWQVELPSGKRNLLHTLKLQEQPGISGIGFPTVTSDGKAYAYQYSQAANTVYVVTGVK